MNDSIKKPIGIGGWIIPIIIYLFLIALGNFDRFNDLIYDIKKIPEYKWYVNINLLYIDFFISIIIFLLICYLLFALITKNKTVNNTLVLFLHFKLFYIFYTSFILYPNIPSVVSYGMHSIPTFYADKGGLFVLIIELFALTFFYLPILLYSKKSKRWKNTYEKNFSFKKIFFK